MSQLFLPPFTEDTARAKVRAAQDLWNAKNPALVALAYTADSIWRNRNEHLQGRDAIEAFLTRKWQTELEYRLQKELFLFSDYHIAVQFEYEWHNNAGQWFRSYGLEHWVFTDEGLMSRRTASINDGLINESERQINS